jgi:hypothetical protein
MIRNDFKRLGDTQGPSPTDNGRAGPGEAAGTSNELGGTTQPGRATPLCGLRRGLILRQPIAICLVRKDGRLPNPNNVYLFAPARSCISATAQFLLVLLSSIVYTVCMAA